MSICKKNYLPGFLCLLFLIFQSCHNSNKPPAEKDIVKHVAKLSERVSEDLQRTLDYIHHNHDQLNDSVSLRYGNLVDSIYLSSNYAPVWSRDDYWLPLADSLFDFIDSCKNYGLFPADYHYHTLAFVHRVFMADSVAKKNAALWARADILFTDAFFRLVKDIKQGRLPYDSVTLRTDTVLPASVFTQAYASARSSGSIISTLQQLEPRYPQYDSLRRYTSRFLAKASFIPYTYLPYPYQDSVVFFQLLEKRLHELNILSPDENHLDSAGFVTVLKKYQKSHGLKVTGHLSNPLVDQLNDTDWERFIRIAINLDRYKLLPDTLPSTYIWVNIPSFTVQVYDDDTLVFQSRVIVGEPDTRTPLLTSEVSNFITYPQWTVPYSVIFKEMLPKIRENVDFLNKENLMVVDKNDSVLDPHTINWKKLNKNHFPYLIKQREGDNNSLGVIKFNFRNKYSVYMHDTNVRWKFANAYRALSHGCVRIKEWQKMAAFLTRTDTLRFRPDSLRAWISRQEKHIVSGFPRVPIYIRYFTCEEKGGKLRFYDDIYDEDRTAREKYFANKAVE